MKREITVREIDPWDVPKVLPWWEERGLGEMYAWLLPPDGWVAHDGEGPLAAGWLGRTLGVPRVARIDWFATRPGVPAGVSRRAALAVLARIEIEARRLGVEYLCCATGFAAMGREIGRAGFYETAAGVKHFAKELLL